MTLTEMQKQMEDERMESHCYEDNNADTAKVFIRKKVIPCYMISPFKTKGKDFIEREMDLVTKIFQYTEIKKDVTEVRLLMAAAFYPISLVWEQEPKLNRGNMGFCSQKIVKNYWEDELIPYTHHNKYAPSWIDGICYADGINSKRYHMSAYSIYGEFVHDVYHLANIVNMGFEDYMKALEEDYALLYPKRTSEKLHSMTINRLRTRYGINGIYSIATKEIRNCIPIQNRFFDFQNFIEKEYKKLN